MTEITILGNKITGRNILQCRIQLLRDNTAQTMPVSNCSLKLGLTEEMAGWFQYNQPFLVEHKGEKYQFYCSKVDRREDIYTVSSVDAIGILAQQDFPNRMYYTTRPSNNILAEIMRDMPYTYDPLLTTIECMGYIGHCSRREALRHFCMGANIVITLNEDGNLHFRPYNQLYIGGDATRNIALGDTEVFDTYQDKKDSERYSKISCDLFNYSTASGYSDQYVEYNGTKYYYTSQKVSKTISDFPDTLPEKELYIKDEKFIATNTMYTTVAQAVNNKLDNYYQKNYSLNIVAVRDEIATNQNIGIGSLGVFGRPTKVDIDAASNAVKYELSGIYEESNYFLIKLEITYVHSDDILKRIVIYGIRGGYGTLDKELIPYKEYGGINYYRPDVPDNKILFGVQAGDQHYQDEYCYVIQREVPCVLAAREEKDKLFLYAAGVVEQTENTLEVKR